MPSISLPAAVIGAGALGAGAAVTSGIIGSDAAKSAAQTQANAANLATNTQLGIFNQTQANLSPYMQVGQSALSQLASLFGLGPGGTGPNAQTATQATSALTQYPGYQFGLKQGQQALSSNAASQGLLLSGGQLAAQQQYGQNYALQQAWNPYVSQLSTLAGSGQNAAANLGTIGTTTGTDVAQTQLAAGQAGAAGTVGSANAVNSALLGGVNAGANSSLLALALQQGQFNNPASYNNSSYALQTGPMNSLGLVNP